MSKLLTRRGAIAAGAAFTMASKLGAAETMAKDESSEVGRMHLRVARPSDDLTAVTKFYRDGLGFEVLYECAEHDGFTCVMLGCKGAPYEWHEL